MAIADKLVLQRQRHLKWRALDMLELVLMILCGVLCFGFSLSVTADIVTRTIGHPWLWLQEVTSTLFIYAIFIGAAVATRRNDHLYLTAISEAMHGTPRLIVEIIIRLVGARRGVLPDLVRLHQLSPRASAASACRRGRRSPRSMRRSRCRGVLIALFTVEQLVNGMPQRLRSSRAAGNDRDIRPSIPTSQTRARRERTGHPGR